MRFATVTLSAVSDIHNMTCKCNIFSFKGFIIATSRLYSDLWSSNLVPIRLPSRDFVSNQTIEWSVITAGMIFSGYTT